MEKMLIRRLQKTFSLIANKFEDGLQIDSVGFGLQKKI